MAKLQDKFYNRVIEGKLELDSADNISPALENSILPVLEDKDVVVNTIEQQEANWSADIQYFPNIGGGTANPIFCRLQKINQELHIIMLGTIANETESAISAYGTTPINIDLPEEIAQKIYDYTGAKASEAGDASTPIISGSVAVAIRNSYVDMSTYANDVIFFVRNVNVANRISVSFSRNTSISIPAGETLYLEGRVYLDLI